MKVILFCTIICLLALITYLFIERTSYKDLLRRTCILHILYVGIFCALAWISIVEVNQYIYPKDPTIFSNADYHTITHFGYKIDDGFLLVNDKKPTDGIWDDRQGTIVLNKQNIQLCQYAEPFYTREESPRRWTLQNLTCDADVGKGFTLLDKSNSPYYKLEIIPVKRSKNKSVYISHIYKDKKVVRTDTSTFNKTIRNAYPLMEIIRQTPSLHNDTVAVLDSIFSNTSLVRECVYTKSRDKRFRKTPILRLGLCEKFLLQNEYKIQNATCTIPNKTITYKDSVTFYSGIGLSKSDEFTLKSADSTHLFLSFGQARRFHMPKWEDFKKDSTQNITEQTFFILSNPQEVVKKSLTQGYLFDVFNETQNNNAIDATLSYRPGTSRERIDFHIKDNKEGESIQKIEINQPFNLNTENAKCKWIIGVEDLRESNPLTAKKIYTFIIVFFLLVCIRILLDKFLQRNSISITELAVYLILLCFGVIRLILMWRVTTFPPISGITPTVWVTMRGNIYKWTTNLFYAIPLIATIISSIYPLLENRLIHNWIIEQYYNLQHSKPYKWIENKYYQSKLYDLYKKKKEICKQWIENKYYQLYDLYKKKKEICKQWIENKLISSKSNWLQKLQKIYIELFLWLKNDGESQFKKVALFAVIMLLCPTLSKIFGQLFNICIPFVCYLLFEWWIITNTHTERTIFNGKLPFPIERILLVLLLAILYLKSDAGIIPVLGIYLFIKHIIYGVLRHHWQNKKWQTSIVSLVCAIFLGTALFFEGDMILKILPEATSNSYLVKKTGHMRWRAETQRIRSNEDLAKLIQECDYDSDEIEMLMRSVHNQWFINQYIKLGDNQRSGYFQIQPHSNQGSTYPTQTTDLVVTRYVLAEHGDAVVFMMMMIFLAMLLIYGLEIGLYNKSNFVVFGGFLFLYTIALIVYLSATNRIVFIGQDFPLLSTQSKTAVLFPILIFMISIFRTAYLRYTDQQFRRETSATQEWVTILLPSLSLIVFSFLTIMINKANLTEDGKQIDNNVVFNISSHIEKIENITTIINEDFQQYQDQQIKNINQIHSQDFDSLWNNFITDSRYNENYIKYANYEDSDNKFIASLLQHFTLRQRNKIDPEQLLHLRKGNYIYLTVNKHYYYISSVDNDSKQWKGDILVSNESNKHRKEETSQYSYQVLKRNRELPNTTQIVYKNSWTLDKSPLHLITIDNSDTQEERFEILLPNETIHSFRKNTMATAVPEFSVLKNYKSSSQKSQIHMTKQVNESKDIFMSKNVWLNGQQQHFYPLVVNRMFSYQFTQWISQSMQKMSDKELKRYQNDNIRLTLDIQLTESFYKQAKEDAKKQKFSDFVAVVIDGDGQIRSLFNYAPKNKNTIDPNDTKLMNKRINEMYTEGSRSTMREMFGTSALLPIPAGPGSTLKPIVYSAVTARIPIEWSTLDMKNNSYIPKKSVVYRPKNREDSVNSEGKGKELYDYYGGLKLNRALSIEGAFAKGQEHHNYILYSNNMYHSVVVMLGMKNPYNFDERHFNNLMKDYHPSLSPTEAFPVFSYNGQLKCFDPNYWWNDNMNNFVDDGSALSLSLYKNFHIQQNPTMNNHYRYSEDYYGNASILTAMYNVSSAHRNWASPEQGSQNTADRRNDPIKAGFNRMFLGADPLKLTPLQMAVNTLRLSTLNKAEHITTLFARDTLDGYEFFDIDENWGGNEKYLKFMQQQVFSQMRQVPKIGTASELYSLVKDMENKGLFLYCKTGTLTQPNHKSNRIKHLMVIISNRELEKVENIEEFTKVKRYVIYFSHYNANGHSNLWLRPYIEKTINSAAFKKYMEE